VNGTGADPLAAQKGPGDFHFLPVSFMSMHEARLHAPHEPRGQ